jgi:hypothetical protein
MKSRRRVTLALLVAVALLGATTSSLAHHGSGISYDLTKPWTTKATVVEFQYINPHPLMLFDRIGDDGKVQHWHSEIITNPSRMIRSGWGRSRSVEALKPGTMVTLTLATAKAGGYSAVVTKIVNAEGEEIITGTGRGGGPPEGQQPAPQQQP